MASKPLPSEDKLSASADDRAPSQSDDGLELGDAERVVPDKIPALPPSEDEDEEADGAIEIEDDEDEELVVFSAKEAAGALTTIYGFVKPYLASYKKSLIFVGLGILVETLFNVIMPLSLKFLIDDALGEEDF